MAEAVPAKETKAQRAERLKREKNPWEAFDEVRAFARAGRSSVVPEWASLYFKWWGIYTQGDGVGATGGKGGEGLASDYFMMRIAIPNGILSAQASFASSPSSPSSTRATWPTSPSARPSSFTGSPSNRSPKWWTRSTPSGSRPKAPAAT
jgi:sulfite reductase beta subunit-like hemoprotein